MYIDSRRQSCIRRQEANGAPPVSAAFEHPEVALEDIEVSADTLDIEQAVAIYREHGCLVVRGLMTAYLDEMRSQIDRLIDESIGMLDRAKKVDEGWMTPNSALFIPAPKNFARDKQLMCLPMHYRNSSVLLQAAMDSRTLELVGAVLGPNVELFMEGQALVKEPVGGHPKHLHQDASYFEHKYEGPMAQLNYVVDTDLNNGALHVVPGSFKLGLLQHVDTFSHLGLAGDEWPWERALPVVGKAGDSIFFHVKCIHGSKPNWSHQPRPVYINRYRRADDYVVVSATTTAKRAAAEKKRGQASKEHQLGLMVRGFRDHDSERG